MKLKTGSFPIYIVVALLVLSVFLNLLILSSTLKLQEQFKSEETIVGTFSRGEAVQMENFAFSPSGEYTHYHADEILSDGKYERLYSDINGNFEKVYVLYTSEGLRNGIFVLKKDAAFHISEDNKLNYYAKKSDQAVILKQADSLP